MVLTTDEDKTKTTKILLTTSAASPSANYKDDNNKNGDDGGVVGPKPVQWLLAATIPNFPLSLTFLVVEAHLAISAVRLY